MNCRDHCRLYSKCKKPCAPMLSYLDNCTVKQRELCIPNVIEAQPLPDVRKSKRRLILEMIFLDRLTNKQIAEKLYLRLKYVDDIQYQALTRLLK